MNNFKEALSLLKEIYELFKRNTIWYMFILPTLVFVFLILANYLFISKYKTIVENLITNKYRYFYLFIILYIIYVVAVFNLLYKKYVKKFIIVIDKDLSSENISSNVYFSKIKVFSKLIYKILLKVNIINNNSLSHLNPNNITILTELSSLEKKILKYNTYGYYLTFSLGNESIKLKLNFLKTLYNKNIIPGTGICDTNSNNNSNITTFYSSDYGYFLLSINRYLNKDFEIINNNNLNIDNLVQDYILILNNIISLIYNISTIKINNDFYGNVYDCIHKELKKYNLINFQFESSFLLNSNIFLFYIMYFTFILHEIIRVNFSSPINSKNVLNYISKFKDAEINSIKKNDYFIQFYHYFCYCTKVLDNFNNHIKGISNAFNTNFYVLLDYGWFLLYITNILDYLFKNTDDKEILQNTIKSSNLINNITKLWYLLLNESYEKKLTVPYVKEFIENIFSNYYTRDFLDDKIIIDIKRLINKVDKKKLLHLCNYDYIVYNNIKNKLK